MMLQELAKPLVMMLFFASCGAEGQRVCGEIEHEGTVVTYQTYYSSPGLIGSAKGSDGITARIAVANRTLSLIAGSTHPKEWDDNEGDPWQYSAEFWTEVTAKFSALPVERGREGDHHLLLGALKNLRDTPRSLPPDTQALRAAPEAVPVHTDPNEKQTTDEEDAYSREMGEKMIAHYKSMHPEEFEEGWSWDPVDARRLFNRGRRFQHREAGSEFK